MTFWVSCFPKTLSCQVKPKEKKRGKPVQKAKEQPQGQEEGGEQEPEDEEDPEDDDEAKAGGRHDDDDDGLDGEERWRRHFWGVPGRTLLQAAAQEHVLVLLGMGRSRALARETTKVLLPPQDAADLRPRAPASSTGAAASGSAEKDEDRRPKYFSSPLFFFRDLPLELVIFVFQETSKTHCSGSSVFLEM